MEKQYLLGSSVDDPLSKKEEVEDSICWGDSDDSGNFHPGHNPPNECQTMMMEAGSRFGGQAKREEKGRSGKRDSFGFPKLIFSTNDKR